MMAENKKFVSHFVVHTLQFTLHTNMSVTLQCCVKLHIFKALCFNAAILSALLLTNQPNKYLTYYLTNCMEQSPSEVSQEIPHILWNPKVHYHMHKSPPRFPVPSQTDTVHALPHVHFNIILPSMSECSKWSPSLKLSALLLPCHCGTILCSS